MKLTLGLLGAGNMAGAIFDGVMKTGLLPPERIWIFNRSEGRLGRFQGLGVHTTTDCRAVAEAASLILLCVKPQAFPQLLPQLSPLVRGKGVVSISPGYSLETLRRALPGCYVMRAMPNTPLSVGRGCTAIVEPVGAPKELAEALEEVFAAAGEVFFVPEALLDTVISVAGSSPAYFFRMAGAMAASAGECGMDPGMALRMAALTMEGAARMLLESGRPAEELTAQVCSPGGTTLAAMDALDEGDFDGLIHRAMERCRARSKELGG